MAVLSIFAGGGACLAAEVSLGEYTLGADQVEIDDSLNTMTATGSARVVGPDGELRAARITIATDAKWEAVESVVAEQNVRFDVTAKKTGGEEGQVERRLTGTCLSVRWGRDQSWKGEASQDKGIIVLQGKVDLEVQTARAGGERTTGRILCETLTIEMNKGRYVARGGADQRAEMKLDLGQQGEKARGDSH